MTPGKQTPTIFFFLITGAYLTVDGQYRAETGMGQNTPQHVLKLPPENTTAIQGNDVQLNCAFEYLHGKGFVSWLKGGAVLGIFTFSFISHPMNYDVHMEHGGVNN